MEQPKTLRAPFPWFGGKSRAAPLVWAALGDVANYVEPFAGSLAVLLARPSAPRVETVNDLDCYLANFWRAVQRVPDEVAAFADWPVNEADLHARHTWLVGQTAFRDRMMTDPEFYEARVAGWWLWGISQWIGDGWCDLGRESVCRKLPNVDGCGGKGVHSNSAAPVEALRRLRARLARTRVACGDWTRVLGDSVTRANGIAGIVLDPPYADGAMDYSAGGTGTPLSAAVRQWAVDHGDVPHMRIILCGYEGEHAMPAGWRSVEWKASRGFGAEANENRHRERIWLSPHCLSESRQQSLFG